MFAISKENLMGKSKIGRKNRQKFKKQKQTEINKKDLKKITKGPRLQNNNTNFGSRKFCSSASGRQA